MHPRVRGAPWALPQLWYPGKDVRHGEPSLCPGPPGIPHPTLASAVLCHAVCGSAGSALPGMGSNPGLPGRGKSFFPYFSLYGVLPGL